jgi:DNA polymerase (family 10)
LIFGIGIARKGWLTKDDVINTLPLAKVRSVLGAKRTRS